VASVAAAAEADRVTAGGGPRAGGKRKGGRLTKGGGWQKAGGDRGARDAMRRGRGAGSATGLAAPARLPTLCAS
jgi:hypothetical protein